MDATTAKWAIVSGVSFLVTALGIVIQWKSGVSSAKVPVGAIILAIIAVITFMRVWRWTPVVGAAFCIFILIMAFVIGGVVSRLTTPGHVGPFLGTLIQMIGLVVAVATGILTAICNAKQ